MVAREIPGGGGFVPAGRLENKYDKNDVLFSVVFFLFDS